MVVIHRQRSAAGEPEQLAALDLDRGRERHEERLVVVRVMDDLEVIAALRACKRSSQGQRHEANLLFHDFLPQVDQRKNRPHYPALRKVKLIRCSPSKGCCAGFRGSTPWYRKRAAPPQTTTSPCSSGTRAGLSALFAPPNTNTAAMPSETETI